MSTFELDKQHVEVYFITIMENETLIKYLAKNGGVSRRNADSAIRAGKVTVDGVCVTRPEFRLSGAERIVFEGSELSACGSGNVYIMLNKPVNYTCSADDGHAEHLAIDLIDVPQRIFSAGRLDRDSEGLLIFSNDGVFIDRLAHPRYGVRKLYHVTTDRPLSDEDRQKMCSGICDAGENIHALEVKNISGKTSSFLLNEGKKREIRRLVKAVGKRVVRLVRVRQGKLELGSLPSGKWRFLTPEEVKLAMESGE